MPHPTNTTASPTTIPADTVFTGGHILTMDAAGSRADAVAVQGGRIVAVGSTDFVQSLTGQRTEMVDLEGRTLIPGLIDPHMHSSMVQLAGWVDVSPMVAPTADDVFAALQSAESTSTGWVLAKQFDPSITEGHPALNLGVLDSLVPDRPLLVLESNGHIAYANSRAFERAGVTKHTPDPAAGELTGRLEESSAQAAFSAGIPFATGDTFVGLIRDLLWHAAGKGVTLLHDCGIGSIAGPADLEALQAAVDADSPVRYRGMLVSDKYDVGQTWG